MEMSVMMKKTNYYECVKYNALFLSLFPLFLPGNDNIKEKGGNSLSDIMDTVKSQRLRERKKKCLFPLNSLDALFLPKEQTVIHGPAAGKLTLKSKY